MSQTYNVDTDAAYAVLYSILGIFTILAVLSAGYGASFLPNVIANLIVARSGGSSEKEEGASTTVADSGVLATDFFLSARNSTGTFGIAMSFFASGMGAWVVYGTTEMGATPALSWLGVLGYSFASAAPALVIMWLGPLVRDYFTVDEAAFSTTDFALKRYGRFMQVAVAAVSVFYMFIYLVAELTSISNVYALLVGKETKDWVNMVDLNEDYTTSIAVSIGVITIFYTSVAGLPSSIVTDKFQGIMMALLVLILTIAVCGSSENQVSYDEFKEASNWTADGGYAFVTLFIAIMAAELFNQSTWQRVWASKDAKSLRNGFALGSFLVFLLMMFFGIMGLIAYANDPESYDTDQKYAYLAFFDLLLPLNEGWHILTLIFVTALAASSVDSLQNGITSILSHDLVDTLKVSPTIVRWISRLALVAVNITAIEKAAERYDVLSLFLVADLVCATSVFPLFLGLLDVKKFGVLAPTEFGAFMGCLGGIATVLVIGIIVDYDKYEKEPFEYFWLANEDICALCGTDTMWTFIITPLVSIVATVIFTGLDLVVRGTAARKNGWIEESPMEEEVKVKELVDDA